MFNVNNVKLGAVSIYKVRLSGSLVKYHHLSLNFVLCCSVIYTQQLFGITIYF
jgi:hypothetical protein